MRTKTNIVAIRRCLGERLIFHCNSCENTNSSSNAKATQNYFAVQNAAETKHTKNNIKYITIVCYDGDNGGGACFLLFFFFFFFSVSSLFRDLKRRLFLYIFRAFSFVSQFIVCGLYALVDNTLKCRITFVQFAYTKLLDGERQRAETMCKCVRVYGIPQCGHHI